MCRLVSLVTAATVIGAEPLLRSRNREPKRRCRVITVDQMRRGLVGLFSSQRRRVWRGSLKAERSSPMRSRTTGSRKRHTASKHPVRPLSASTGSSPTTPVCTIASAAARGLGANCRAGVAFSVSEARPSSTGCATRTPTPGAFGLPEGSWGHLPLGSAKETCSGMRPTAPSPEHLLSRHAAWLGQRVQRAPHPAVVRRKGLDLLLRQARTGADSVERESSGSNFVSILFPLILSERPRSSPLTRQWTR